MRESFQDYTITLGETEPKSASTGPYLSKGFAKVLGQEGVQERIYATAAIRQDMCRDLHNDVHMGQLVFSH